MRRFPAGVAVVTLVDGERPRAHGRLARLALARAAARRRLDRPPLPAPRAAARGRALRRQRPRRRPGAPRPALRAQRAADRALGRRRSARRRARAAPRRRARLARVRRAPSTRRATTRSSSPTCSRSRSAAPALDSPTTPASTGASDERRGSRLRPRRRAAPDRGGLGRGARGARPRARRPLRRRGAAGDDGHELARVVALSPRRARRHGRAPRRSRPRSSAACSRATASACR